MMNFLCLQVRLMSSFGYIKVPKTLLVLIEIDIGTVLFYISVPTVSFHPKPIELVFLMRNNAKIHSSIIQGIMIDVITLSLVATFQTEK